MDFVLREYQGEGIEHFVQNKRTLVPLPGGTGKSCIPLLASLKMGVGTIVILCSSNAFFTWVKQINMHRLDLAPNMVVLDKSDKRKAKKYEGLYYQKTSDPNCYNDPKYKVVIAKARSFFRDYPNIKYAPQLLILDEPQKYLRKRSTVTYNAIFDFAQSTPYVCETTGSSTSRGRQDFYNLLHLLNPKRFSSYWRFVNQYCIVVRGFFGTEVRGARNTEQFREATKQVMFRPSTGLGNLPKVLRDTIPCEMLPDQENFYRQIQSEMWGTLSDGRLILASNTLVKITRLRQILCCPKILDPNLSYGAGILTVLDHMEEDPTERQHCIWATPFTDAIPYMQQALKENGYPKQVIFKGGMGTEDIKACEEFFRANLDCVAICSIPFAQSYELEIANPVYFIGYSFDPQENEQMEWRARRLTTERPFINSYYVQNLGTYDDFHLQQLSNYTLNTRVDYQDMHALLIAFGRPT